MRVLEVAKKVLNEGLPTGEFFDRFTWSDEDMIKEAEYYLEERRKKAMGRRDTSSDSRGSSLRK